MTQGYLDKLEKYGVAVAFAVLFVRNTESYFETGNLAALFYVFDELIIVFFLLARRPTQAISDRLPDWLLGVGGTFLPLMVSPPGPSPVAPIAAVAILMLCGTAMHLAAKVRLWRSFGVVAANRGVVDKGVYGIVRHPMYLGYIVVQSGLLLAGPTLLNILLVFSTWGTFFLRINAEEKLLSADPAYRDFMARIPYRLVPGLY